MAMKKCKECGEEISSSAKVCPKCGKKQKSKFGLIVIILIVLAIIIGISAGSSDNSNNNQETNVKSSYEIGDTYSSKYISIKYLSCEDYNSDNQFIQPKDNYKFIRLEFEFENISDSDQSVFSSLFNCYADGYDMDSKYLDDYLSSTSLSSGKKTKGYIYFEVPTNAEEITVEYEDNVWTSNKVIFKVK
jgi:hypothetical protein